MVKLTTKVEQDAISSVSRGSYYYEDASFCNSSFAPKEETDQNSDLKAESNQAIYDLIKAKRYNIMLLTKLNKSEKKMLQLQECEAKL